VRRDISTFIVGGGVVIDLVASGVAVEVDELLMAVEEVLEADNLAICCAISSRKNPEWALRRARGRW